MHFTLPLCDFYSLLLCHKATSVHLPPPPDNWYTYFFFLAGPRPQHEVAVSEFWRSPVGHTNTFSILSSRISLECSSSFTLFSALVVPFFLSFPLLLSCTPQIHPWTLSLLGFLLFPSMLYRLRFPTLVQLAVSLHYPIQRC